MTPFVGRHFNVTRAGIHADGLQKDEEIYNIFDTSTILNRPALVAISNTSGLAGIAFWINTSYGLEGKDRLEKSDPLVTTIKDWIDEQYAAGRQTVISDEEMDALLEKFAPGRFSIQ